jgi:8-oxo-dGTP pyrophosphatase MutT (NUDIX family)
VSIPARDAATVLLLREDAHGLEVFLVRRNTVVDFMAGAHVFPGGKVDPEDSDPALVGRLRGALESGTPPELYIAAIRETLEEAGILLGSTAEEKQLAAARRALHERKAFASVAAELDAALDADLLMPWTRWVTPVASPKRFDARFFLAAAPAEQLASHDEHETTESVWIRALDAIHQVEEGKMLVAPATYKCLAVLATYRDLNEAFTAARRDPPRTWCPVVRMENGKRLILLSDDAEHPDRFARMPGPTRMVFDGGRFLPAGD